MEKNTTWFTIQPAKGVKLTTQSSTSTYGQFMTGGMHARPGDLFRTPKAILERHQNGGKIQKRNPFDLGR